MQKQTYFFLFLFFALINGGLQAQVVTIPDANFLARLIQLGVDTNGDGQIQQVEAASVDTTLNLNYANIGSLVGLNAFVNLKGLGCYHNHIDSLDVSSLVNLKSLSCVDNQITSLDVTNCTHLVTLYCATNKLSSLNVNGLDSLTTLNCYQNEITSLNLSNLSQLTYLDCDSNSLVNLDVNALANLQYLRCGQNPFPYLNVSNLPNLLTLDCSEGSLDTLIISNLPSLQSLTSRFGQLASLSMSNLPNLQNIDCQWNHLNALFIDNLPNLQIVYVHHNLIDSLSVNNLPLLQELVCFNNQLNSLTLNNLPSLLTLHCSDNLLTTLDLAGAVNVLYLYCNSNQLITVFLKPLAALQISNILGNNPNLQYICVGPGSEGAVYGEMQQSGVTNIVVNSFCTYAPGGNYNTILGRSRYDEDTNGCTSADSGYSYLMISVSDGINTSYTCSGHDGKYATFLGIGNYTLSPQAPNPTYFSLTPSTANISFPSNNDSTQIQDFCITPTIIFSDISVVFFPLTAARPGFDATYQILFRNNGTTTASGNITFDFMGNKMSLVSSSLVPSSQLMNQLTWAYSNLQPFESRSITLVMHILPPPINAIGNLLNFNIDMPLANDLTPANNTFSYNQNISNAFDPNDKTCLEGNLVNNSKIGEYLHYLVRFQNTGNYPAENVVVADALNASKYDIASLQVLETSHEAHIDVKNNVLQFYFENIQLADSFSNEPASHGYVLYKIKTKAALPQNSSVSNKAEIYFDFNPPVITNTETTTFANGVGIDNSLASTHFQCFPNPARNLLSLTTSRPIEIEIVNVLGEMLMRKQVQDKENMDISSLANGMYWIKERNTGAGQIFVKE